MARLDNDQFGPSASAFDLEAKAPVGPVRGQAPADLFDYLFEEWSNQNKVAADPITTAFRDFCKAFFLHKDNRVRGYAPVTGGLALNLTDGRQLVVRFDDLRDDGGVDVGGYGMAMSVREKPARDLGDGGYRLDPPARK